VRPDRSGCTPATNPRTLLKRPSLETSGLTRRRVVAATASIGAVVPPAQCMADAFAVDAVLGVDELGTGVDNLGFVDPCFEFECPGRPTASLQRP
jgi:hypothetical protein